MWIRQTNGAWGLPLRAGQSPFFVSAWDDSMPRQKRGEQFMLELDSLCVKERYKQLPAKLEGCPNDQECRASSPAY
jgi:hypothetical protein